VTPPPAAAARLDSASNCLCPRRSRRAHRARARRPAVQGHRADPGVDGLSRRSDVTAKYLSATLPSIEIAWIRFLVFALIMVPAMLPGSPLFALQTERPGLQVMRGVALLASSLFFISGLRFLPIAEASATGFVAPLFVTALSIVFLGEKRRRAPLDRDRGRPDRRADHPAAGHRRVSSRRVLPARLGAGLGLHLIMTRMMSGTERAITTMTYSSIAGVCILSALVPFVWVTPSWHDILFGIFIGVASTAGQWIVVLAFRYADASVLAPFSYTQLLWVSILGFLIFGECLISGPSPAPPSSSPAALHRASRAGQALAAAGHGRRAVAERLIAAALRHRDVLAPILQRSS
jgi:uncharacterized membrane protein